MAKKGAISKATAGIIIAIIVVVGVVGAAWYIISLPPAPPAKEKILVGWVHSITGPGTIPAMTATFDVYYRWIIEDYNNTGGLFVPEYGKKLPFATPIEYDDEFDVAKMLSYTEKLITVDKVDILFAPMSTGMCYAAMPTYEKYKYPVVCNTFGSERSALKMRTGEYSYSFSTLGFPSETGDEVDALFKYINTTKAPGQLNSVGIIYHNLEHGVEYASAIRDRLLLDGFSVPYEKSYLAFGIPGGVTSASDFYSMVNDLSLAGVDVAILCGYEGNLFLRACMDKHYNPDLVVVGPGCETGFLEWMDVALGGYGFTPAQLSGTVLYDGWPGTSYKTVDLKAWANMHYGRAHYYPFPASVTFYVGLECIFKAVQLVGLNGTKIRDALLSQTFTTILGQTHLRPGYSMECSLTGTICQWQGGVNSSEVIWPLTAVNVSNIIYPKPTSW